MIVDKIEKLAIFAPASSPYSSHAITSQNILKKITGNITIFSFDAGETLPEKKYPFDCFVQIIDGDAHIIADGHTYVLHQGEAMIVPAHTLHAIHAAKRFKMIFTLIKSGYE